MLAALAGPETDGAAFDHAGPAGRRGGKLGPSARFLLRAHRHLPQLRTLEIAVEDASPVSLLVPLQTLDECPPTG